MKSNFLVHFKINFDSINLLYVWQVSSNGLFTRRKDEWGLFNKHGDLFFACAHSGRSVGRSCRQAWPTHNG
jgi:hypothetical protein